MFLVKKGFITGYDSYRTSIYFDKEYKLSIQYNGVSAVSPEAQKFFGRKINFYLQKVTTLLYLSNSSFEYLQGDSICDSLAKNTETKNSLLLQNIVKENTIPQKYVCLLTYKLMDSPVYIKGTPGAVYDEGALKYWLYQQDTPKDPTSNVNIQVHEDIVKMPELKKEIALWVKENLQTGLTAKNQLFFNTLNRYKIGEYGPAEAEKALRKAAFANNLDDFNFLVEFIIDINRQDENPTNKKTAFHWAVTKSSIDVIKRLIELRADPFIKDAANKTCLDYAFESKNETVKTLLVDYVKELSSKNMAMQ